MFVLLRVDCVPVVEEFLSEVILQFVKFHCVDELHTVVQISHVEKAKGCSARADTFP